MALSGVAVAEVRFPPGGGASRCARLQSSSRRAVQRIEGLACLITLDKTTKAA